MYNCSRELCSFVLQAINIVVGLIYTSLGKPGPRIAKDVRTALKQFNIEPVLKYGVQCLSCGVVTPIKDGSFPERCPNMDEDGVACDEALGVMIRFRGEWVHRAKRLVPCHTLAQWNARFFARPGYEEMMDKTSRSARVKDPAADIWDTSLLHSIPWADGASFSDAPQDELRLVYGLAIDWFSVHHSPAGKKTWSVGAIYLINYNLPPDIRYRTENICLYAIIPGPRKPSKEMLDQILKPLVDEFLEHYEPGKLYSRTASHTGSRRVRAILLFLIADLDACRGVAGFSGVRFTYFCSYCYLDLDSINNFDVESWTKRTGPKHIAEAARYASPAHNEQPPAHGEQPEDIVMADKASGIDFGARPSQLNRLPYWDPVKQMVPEPAHLLLLGNLARHCRVGFHMDLNVAGGDGSKIPIPTSVTKEALAQARSVYTTGKEPSGRPATLKDLRQPQLYALCVEYEILNLVEGRHNVKKTLMDALERHVSLAPQASSVN